MQLHAHTIQLHTYNLLLCCYPPPPQEVLSAFGFSEYEINLSTRPEKYVGDDAIWDTAEAALKEALAAKGWSYGVDEGGGYWAFWVCCAVLCLMCRVMLYSTVQ